MAKRKKDEDAPQELSGLGGWLTGLTNLVDKLGDLAGKGEELHKSGEISDPKGKVRAVYGFTIKTAGGGDGLEVQPFGNVAHDRKTGQPTVREEREPMVDVFEEDDHVLVVAELPGIDESDVTLDLNDDILTIVAAHGDKKYRKEVLLPRAFAAERMSHACHNGVLEVKFAKPAGREAGK